MCRIVCRGFSVKRFAGREPVDHAVRPHRLVVRYHVTGVPDQQHGERSVRGGVTGRGGVAPQPTVGHGLRPDRTIRFSELLGTAPPERFGHFHRALVRHDRVQQSGVEEHSVQAGVQELGEPRGHGQRYVVSHPAEHLVHPRKLVQAHVQGLSDRRALHVLEPVTVLVGYRVVFPHHVVDVFQAGKLGKQRQWHGHRVERGAVVARGDQLSSLVVHGFHKLLTEICKDVINTIFYYYARRTLNNCIYTTE